MCYVSPIPFCSQSLQTDTHVTRKYLFGALSKCPSVDGRTPTPRRAVTVRLRRALTIGFTFVESFSDRLLFSKRPTHVSRPPRGSLRANGSTLAMVMYIARAAMIGGPSEPRRTKRDRNNRRYNPKLLATRERILRRIRSVESNFRSP